jgi:hypothetical protein
MSSDRRMGVVRARKTSPITILETERTLASFIERTHAEPW